MRGKAKKFFIARDKVKGKPAYRVFLEKPHMATRKDEREAMYDGNYNVNTGCFGVVDPVTLKFSDTDDEIARFCVRDFEGATGIKLRKGECVEVTLKAKVVK